MPAADLCQVINPPHPLFYGAVGQPCSSLQITLVSRSSCCPCDKYISGMLKEPISTWSGPRLGGPERCLSCRLTAGLPCRQITSQVAFLSRPLSSLYWSLMLPSWKVLVYKPHPWNQFICIQSLCDLSNTALHSSHIACKTQAGFQILYFDWFYVVYDKSMLNYFPCNHALCFMQEQ